MLDMLKLRSHEKIDLDAVKECYPHSVFERKLDANYKICHVVSYQGNHFATIKTNPHWSNVYETQIQLNPSRWASLDSLTDSLSTFCEPGNLEIVRLDHAVDVDLPLDIINAGIRIKHKQYSSMYIKDEAYCGQITGLYLGKEPEQYCCYDSREG
jgi:hypothetical protein